MVRATVRASQAKARATRARKRRRGRRSRARPGRPRPGRHAAGPPRPALRLRRPRHDGRDAVPGRPGQGALRRPGRRRLRRRARRRPPTTPARWPPLRRVVSPEPVLTPEIAALTADVAERYAGTRSDVLRLAVPARHATDREGALAARARRADRRRPRRRRGLARPRAAARPSSRHLADGGSPARGLGGGPGRPTGRTLLAHAAAATYAGGPRGAALRPRRQGRRPGRRARSPRCWATATTSR